MLSHTAKARQEQVYTWEQEQTFLWCTCNFSCVKIRLLSKVAYHPYTPSARISALCELQDESKEQIHVHPSIYFVNSLFCVSSGVVTRMAKKAKLEIRFFVTVRASNENKIIFFSREVKRKTLKRKSVAESGLDIESSPQ